MAHSLNKIQLIGNLGDDPKIVEMENGQQLANLSVATSESYTPKGQSEKVTKTEWHRAVSYGKAAEILGKYAKKGQKIYLEGQLRHRSYEDKDGITRYVSEINVRDFIMLSPKEGSGLANPPAAPVMQDPHDPDLPF